MTYKYGSGSGSGSGSINNKLGGKALSSGGYGCVFFPALKCKNDSNEDKNKYVSKLMFKKYAMEEYNLIKSISMKLKKVPNYENYYLLKNIKLCKPEPLTDADLKNFESICSALSKKDLHVNNVNNNLNELLILKMPNGGKTIDNYIKQTVDNDNSLVNFKEINTKLINLLFNGIIPMNNQNVYHCDIKGSNVLVDSDNLIPRLIDWGLSTQYKPHDSNEIPEEWKNYAIQFNTPFASAFLASDFMNFFTNYKDVNENNMLEFIYEYVKSYVSQQRHYKTIKDIVYMLYFDNITNDDIEYYELVTEKKVNNKNDEDTRRDILSEKTLKIVSDYLYEITIKYDIIKNNMIMERNITNYINDNYIYIVDIWGFMMCYLDIMEMLFTNYDNLNNKEMELFNLIRQIYIKYLYNNGVVEISYENLKEDLLNMNNYFISNVSPSNTSIAKYSYYKNDSRIKKQKYLLKKKDDNMQKNATFNKIDNDLYKGKKSRWNFLNKK